MEIEEEVKSIEGNKTWTKAVLPSPESKISCKFVSKWDLEGKGNVPYFKGWIPAKVFFKKEGVEYSDRFVLGLPLYVLLPLIEKFELKG